MIVTVKGKPELYRRVGRSNRSRKRAKQGGNKDAKRAVKAIG